MTRLYASILILSFTLTSCDYVSDSIRSWGEKSRRRRIEKLSDADLETWERDLKLSRERLQELHENIEEIAQESEFQGNISWKLGRAYMARSRFEQAAMHYSDALQNRLNKYPHEYGERISSYDNAIPYFNEALKRNRLNPELVFEAALCYANASRAIGWEMNRWMIAEYLFRRLREIDPEDTRSLYQLALLYGKTTDRKFRDMDLAVSLLEETVKRQQNDIPARFALAHMLVESGQMDKARKQYSEIMHRIENMHESGILKGKAEKNIKYRTARDNLQKLESCIQDSSKCEVRTFE